MITYIEVLALGFPGVEAHCIGDATIYENLVWDSGVALPSKETLDTWIAANPNAAQSLTVLTKFAFRQLFTFQERVLLENMHDNTQVAPEIKAAVNTMLNDLKVVDFVDLTDPYTQSAVNLLEQFQLLAPGRAAQILSGQKPQ